MADKLTPRNAPNSENLHPDEKAQMEEIAKLVADENHAFSVMAQAQVATQEAVEDMAADFQDMKAILVKVCQKFGVDLPASVQASITSGEYDPDEIDDEEEGDPA